MYERTSAEQQEAVSKIMSTEKTTFDEKLKNRPSKCDRTLDSKHTLACDLGGIFRDISLVASQLILVNLSNLSPSVSQVILKSMMIKSLMHCHNH